MVWPNGLRVVDGIACLVVSCSIWKVAHIVAELQVCKSILLVFEHEALSIDSCVFRRIHACAGAHECCSRCLLGPVESGCLHRRLAGVAKLLLPAWVDLVSILLESEVGALDLLMGLGVLDDAIRQGHVSKHAGLPLLPGLLTLTARHCAWLWR